MGKEYAVKILSWEKYQSRKVKERSAWLRLQNDFIENPNFSEFTSNERLVWLYALCCASKLNTAVIQVPLQCSHRVLNRCTGVDENEFHRAFEKLKKLRIVEIRTSRGRYADDTSDNAEVTLRNETGRNEDETRRDETKNYSSERFEKPLEAVISCFQSLSETFRERSVTEKVQQSWIEAFPDSEWITEEIRKALAWELANPIRRKKNFAAFITRWLTKGWDQRKTSPGGAPVDWNKVFGKESA